MAKIKKQVTLLEETITKLEAEGMGSLSTGIELVFREWSRGGTAAPAKHTTPKEKTFDLPDEDDVLAPYRNHPENPGHRGDTAARLYKRDLAAQEAIDAPRRWFAKDIHDKLANPSSDHQIPDVIRSYEEKYGLPMDWMLSTLNTIKQDADGSIARERAELLQAWAELDAKRESELARKKQFMDAGYTEAEAMRRVMAQDGHGQTLKLSPAALKATNMTTTPDWMTDEQIAETNALHAMTPAAKAEAFEQPATPAKKEPTLSELWAANPLVVEEVEVLGPGEVLTDEN